MSVSGLSCSGLWTSLIGQSDRKPGACRGLLMFSEGTTPCLGSRAAWQAKPTVTCQHVTGLTMWPLTLFFLSRSQTFGEVDVDSVHQCTFWTFFLKVMICLYIRDTQYIPYHLSASIRFSFYIYYIEYFFDKYCLILYIWMFVYANVQIRLT